MAIRDWFMAFSFRRLLIATQMVGGLLIVFWSPAAGGSSDREPIGLFSFNSGETLVGLNLRMVPMYEEFMSVHRAGCVGDRSSSLTVDPLIKAILQPSSHCPICHPRPILI